MSSMHFDSSQLLSSEAYMELEQELMVRDVESVTIDIKLTCSFVSILLFLSVLKIIYLCVLERKSKGFILKMIVTGSNLIALLLTDIGMFLLFEGTMKMDKWISFSLFVNLFINLTCLASILILFLHWVSMMTNIFDIRKGKLLSRNERISFISVFYGPNFILSILTFIFYVAKVPGFEKLSLVSTYFVTCTSLVIILVLYCLLINQLFKMDPSTRNNTKKFFITAFVFSTTTFLLLLLNFLTAYNIQPYELYWVNILTILFFEFQVVFTVFPFNIHKIIKYYNPDYVKPPKKELFKKKNSNQVKIPMDTIKETNLSFGDVQP
ncbi:hypothetical protein CYY_000789 [Polysphondylium violaceum]|uniref:Uncharacterized protein n=1 Tax=Polysphondylium violaceum TaxID=133409 RepID=A0A8J4UWV1_9MYCE|nr:hypothetical protein CYY_000789 [Polysphondylium violaceum]